MEVERLVLLQAEADLLLEQVRGLLPHLADARRRYAATSSDINGARVDEIQAETLKLNERLGAVIAAMEAATGLSPEEIEAYRDERKSPAENNLPRRTLSEDRVAVTEYINDHVPKALERILRHLPRGWRQAEPPDRCRLSTLVRPEAFLSITKGCRPESEAPSMHRFRQALQVSEDFSNGNLAYDHFAGAVLVSSIVQLGRTLDSLRSVGGNVEERLSRLWLGQSDEVDGTFLELFTAAGCAEAGRSVEFLEEGGAKSPDLRCHDPFPLVIECKRQRALSVYELSEDAVMRDVFARLQIEASKRGLYGRFSLRLSVESSTLDRDEVTARLISQRLAPHPEKELAHPWGHTAFVEIPRRVRLPRPTRLYSPSMLEAVFGWESDLPDWDGLCCRMEGAYEGMIDQVEAPLGLVWDNTSEAAMRKRTWAPTNLLGQAVNQIPPGEFGIVYLAHIEGAREEVSDLRVNAFLERIRGWEHAGNIRVPISYLLRLYPRALGDGVPDLIESAVHLVSDEWKDSDLLSEFPSTVFTRSPT